MDLAVDLPLLLQHPASLILCTMTVEDGALPSASLMESQMRRARTSFSSGISMVKDGMPTCSRTARVMPTGSPSS